MTDSSAHPKRIFWDSCVLIGWMKSEGEKYQMIQPVVDELNREDSPVTLFLSVLSRVEVIGTSEGMPSDTTEELEKFISGSNVRIVAVNDEIAKKAREIRERSISENKKLTTPDAIHLATAIILGVDTFHTFDKGLLRLDGSPIAEGVEISACEMPGGQLTLIG